MRVAKKYGCFGRESNGKTQTKKFCCVLLAIPVFLFMTGCSYKDFYKVAHQEKIFFERAEELYDAIINEDTETIMDMFSQEALNYGVSEANIEEFYAFFCGNIVSYEGIQSIGSTSAYDKGECEKLVGGAELTNVKTDIDYTYYISFSEVLIYPSNEDLIGISRIAAIRYDINDEIVDSIKIGPRFED